jgi:hypothetical protein
MRLDECADAPFFFCISCIIASNDPERRGGAQESSVSAMRHPQRFVQSVAMVETIVDHLCTNHSSISRYGLKKQPPSYDVWVEVNDTIVTVQSLTREIIMACTDPDAETAVALQSFIERGIWQGLTLNL